MVDDNEDDSDADDEEDDDVFVADVATLADVADGSLSLPPVALFFFLTNCSALLISSSVTPWVERRVSRTRFAWAFRWVSLSSSLVGGTNDLLICPEVGVVVGVPEGLVGGETVAELPVPAVGVSCVDVGVVGAAGLVVLPNTKLLVVFLNVR